MSLNMNFSANTKETINDELSRLSDFSKIYYLERLIHEKKDIAVKRFCHNKLAIIYLDKGMYSKAAENVEAMARMATSYDEKIKAFINEIKLLVRGADYQKAEAILEKVLSISSPLRKIELRKEFIRIYKDMAGELERDMKRGSSLQIYERILKLGDEIDKREARERLLILYLALGKMQEYNRMRGSG